MRISDWSSDVCSSDLAAALRPLGGRAPFGQLRDLTRRVQADCAVDIDTNSYSVPWRLIGETVLVTICAGRVVIRHAGEVVADHAVCPGRRQRITDRTHFAGVRSEEHTSELQSLMRISYAVFCLKNKKDT